MNSSQATLVMIALFALRCIVPIIITILIGTWMNRLVAYWDAKEEAMIQAATAEALAPTTTQAVACWLLNNCSESNCPAYKQTGLLCWQARLAAEQKLPTGCPDCDIYLQTAAG